MTHGRIAGVALAGGESSRMGRDKTVLTWPPAAPNGEPLWRHGLDRLRLVTGEVVLADGGRGLAAESIADGPGRGPVAGILGAAQHLPGRSLLVLAVDLPRIPVALLRHLAERAVASTADWVVPRRARGLEPLCAVYGPRALRALVHRAESGVFDLYGLADHAPALRLCEVTERDLGRFGTMEDLFFNVNRPEDWQRADP